ncbi:Na+/H+ antiporter NhaC family protein [Lysobacter pythonis]|uniref:Na+/H+ antiporter NhaC family protein n=1 Tax=Solilutibacter pythonis TaxID=2483112 RepID=A0A3M2I3B2_9GAMM|nr:Na+/H+ antiporter NhaC family protein [Lysobacter pythonis]RMH94470.1 Na+/H+ antiporter NhaC family protein [Lysobacter pythonis]
MNLKPGAAALLPLLLFLALFFGAGVYFTAQGDPMGFYALRAPVAILPALALAAWWARRRGVDAGRALLSGMGDSNVMLMCLIFLLAGAFAAVTKAVGAVDAVVALGIGHLPPALVLPGLFVVAGFISLAIGSSMGTLAAVVPIALGVAEAAGLPLALVVASAVGGAMFGDNLSVISDTTIAATRTQGAEMKDKFRENLKIALPAAVATVLLLAAQGGEGGGHAPQAAASPWLVTPYLLVLVMAVSGLNVLVVLGVGIVAAALAGVLYGAQGYDVVRWTNDIWSGFEGMTEILLLSILIGGLAELTRASGGLAWISEKIARLAGGRRGPRSGELGIAALSTATDVFTANNTVAILVSGPLAKDIAGQHGVSPRRAASLLDIYSCVAQGLIPWGAQILLAASLAGVSPLSIAGQVWYCWLLGVVALGFMLWPRRADVLPETKEAA